MKMKKELLKMLIIVITVITCCSHVYAADLIVSNDGFEALGENEVQLISEKLTIENAKNQNGLTISGDLALMRNKEYTAEEIANGTFDSERSDTNIVSYNSFINNAYVIVYNKPLTAGEHAINGEAILKWKDAAFLQDGTLCDVTMTINNFKIKVNRDTTKPIGTVHDTKTFIWMGAYYANQEVEANSLTEDGKIQIGDLGVGYDIEISVTESGSNKKIAKNMAIGFSDIDVTDHSLGTIDNVISRYEVNGLPAPYTESITLINGINEKVHLTSDSVLRVANTENGINTKYYGSVSTTGVDKEKTSGFVLLANSASFKYRWTGSACGTGISIIDVKKVITSTSGNFKDNVKITATDNEVLWKENKKIVITPDDNYYVSKITIDGEELSYDKLPLVEGKRIYTKDDTAYEFTESNGIVTYIFSEVTEDHSIDVQVEKNESIIVIVPPTKANTIFITVGTIVLIIAAGTIIYINKNKN